MLNRLRIFIDRHRTTTSFASGKVLEEAESRVVDGKIPNEFLKHCGGGLKAN